MQRVLQEQVYGKGLNELEGDELKEAVRTHVLALLDEAHEVLHEVPWKPWKRTGEPNWEAYHEELVDLFHFVMNLMLIGGATAHSLLAGYEAKHRVNIERQRDGY